VVSVEGKGGGIPCQVGIKETNESKPLDDVSKAYRRRQNRGESLTRDKSGGNLFTAQTASGIKTA
jgi:hypothetical protein